MLNSFIALLGSVGFLWAAVLFYGYVYNQLRKKQSVKVTLHPNCLLTRFPIVFIGGAESRFYNGRYWNFIPKALKDHGYEVFEMQAIGKTVEARKADLRNFAKLMIEENLSCHWICVEADFPILEELSRSYPMAFRSLTAPALPAKVPQVFDFNLLMHNLIQPKTRLHSYLIGHPKIEEKSNVIRFYLAITKKLAEMDYQHHEDTNEEFPATTVRT